MPALTGAQRERALELLADLDAAMRHASAQLGRFISRLPDRYDPPLPGRNALAALAKQGQALLRDEALKRPPDTDDIAWTRRATRSWQNSTNGAKSAPGARGVMPSGPGETIAWPQVQIRLGR